MFPLHADPANPQPLDLDARRILGLGTDDTAAVAGQVNRGDEYNGGRFVGYRSRTGVVWICYGDDGDCGRMCQAFDEQRAEAEMAALWASEQGEDGPCWYDGPDEHGNWTAHPL